MALNGSLKKILLLLLSLMLLVLMFYYWNQDDIQIKASNGFLNIFNNNNLNANLLNINYLEKTNRNKLVDNQFINYNNKNAGGLLFVADNIILPEKSWTYKCINNRCVRQHFPKDNNINSNNNNNIKEENENVNDNRRTTFLTCSMECGLSNIWPQPTIKTIINNKSIIINADNIKLNIITKYNNINKLFLNAYNIFINDIKNLYTNYVDNNNNNHLNKIDNNNLIQLDVHIIKSDEEYLTLDTDESYNLTINYDKNLLNIKILGNTFFGVRNGLMTLQQLIWYDDEYNVLKILTKAVIEDEPKFKYRGIMLDTSRHYFSVESIKRILVGMAYTKLNRFHWHITDSQSFPYLSKYYPELAIYGAYSSAEIYTNNDIKDIVEFGRVRGIQIIPEIDAPAHAGNGWDWGPKHGLGDLSLCINQQPWSYYCGEPPCGQLNPKNNNTYLILQKLYSELLDVIGPTDYFHLGGDEVNLECWSQYFNETEVRTLWCDFMLQALQRLKIANKGNLPSHVAVWSSGLTSSQCLSKNQFTVQVWGGSTWPENYDLIENGFNIIISHVDAWYLDCGFGSWRSTGDGACSPYRTWQNIYKHRPWERMHLTQPQLKQVLGGEACLWTEQVDESILDSRIWPRAAALAERLWSDPHLDHDLDIINKDVFNRISVLRNRLINFGIKAEPIFPKYCAQNQEECL